MKSISMIAIAVLSVSMNACSPRQVVWTYAHPNTNQHTYTNRYTNAYFYCIPDEYPDSYGNSCPGWAM